MTTWIKVPAREINVGDTIRAEIVREVEPEPFAGEVTNTYPVRIGTTPLVVLTVGGIKHGFYREEAVDVVLEDDRGRR